MRWAPGALEMCRDPSASTWKKSLCAGIAGRCMAAWPGPRCRKVNRGRTVDWRRGGLGVETPILNTFLVLTAFNCVLPEIVVLISTTSSGRTELNAVSTRKVFKIGVSTPRPPRLATIYFSDIN